MDKESKKYISRRAFLKVSGLALFSLTEAGCSTQTKSFNYEKISPNGKTEVFLPLGETRPETGTYTLHLDPEVLIKNPNSGDSVIKYPEFRIEVTMVAQNVNRLLINTLVGRAEEEVARDGWKGVINNPELTQPHILTASWKDWEFQEVAWDGNILFPQSDTEDL